MKKILLAIGICLLPFIYILILGFVLCMVYMMSYIMYLILPSIPLVLKILIVLCILIFIYQHNKNKMDGD